MKSSYPESEFYQILLSQHEHIHFRTRQISDPRCVVRVVNANPDFRLLGTDDTSHPVTTAVIIAHVDKVDGMVEEFQAFDQAVKVPSNIDSMAYAHQAIVLLRFGNYPWIWHSSILSNKGGTVDKFTRHVFLTWEAGKLHSVEYRGRARQSLLDEKQNRLVSEQGDEDRVMLWLPDEDLEF